MEVDRVRWDCGDMYCLGQGAVVCGRDVERSGDEGVARLMARLTDGGMVCDQRMMPRGVRLTELAEVVVLWSGVYYLHSWPSEALAC